MGAHLAERIGAEQPCLDLDAGEAEALGREARDLLVGQLGADRQRVGVLGFVEQALEAALVARLDLDDLAERLDGAVQVDDLLGVDLERVGRVVAGQHDTVAVLDQAAVGHDGHDGDAVGLRALGEAVVLDDLQPHQPRHQQPEAEQHERARGQHAQPEARQLLVEVLQDDHGRLKRSQRPVRIAVRRTALRGEQQQAGQGPQGSLEHRRQQHAPARPHAAHHHPHDQRQRVGGEKQRRNLHGLRTEAEPGQAAMQRDRAEAQAAVGQRMLAQQGAIVHVDGQAEDEGPQHADAARLVHAPEHQHHGQHIGHRGHPAQRDHVEHQRDDQRERDEPGVGRQQQLLGGTRHDHGVPPEALAAAFSAAFSARSAFLAARRAALVSAAEAAAAAAAASASFLAATWRSIGCSTSTWRALSGWAIGASSTCAKLESPRRSTSATLATGRPGG
mmetsp:Transcript_37511/g.87367  ORF Transcript_37511/g.87367 Transcript_37511/m.87367 type:complete len:447 (+) Transcript_37511:3636-4976(+)